MRMRTVTTSFAPSIDDALFVVTLGVLVIAKISGIDALLGGAALSLARDVGENCDPACMLGAIGAAFAAFGAGLTDPWGTRADNREREQWRQKRWDQFLEHHPKFQMDGVGDEGWRERINEWQRQNPYPPKDYVDGLMRFYKVYQAAAEFIGGKERTTSLCACGKA